MTLATRNVLMTKYAAAPSATAATWPALSEPDGAATPRLAASPAPAAMRTWPTLKADLTTERLRPAWARTVATQRVPSVTSGGTSRARITKKPSSMLSASDSPHRYTTTGHTQLPRARAPMAAAAIHWPSWRCAGAGCRHSATARVTAPPTTEAATSAQVAPGNLIEPPPR